jgi:hypothetical protein
MHCALITNVDVVNMALMDFDTYSNKSECNLRIEACLKQKQKTYLLNQIGSGNDKQSVGIKEEGKCAFCGLKMVKVFQPCGHYYHNLLNTTKDKALISLEIRNDTGIWNYADSSIKDNIIFQPCKGMVIQINDIYCDIKRSIVHSLENGMAETEFMEILSKKGDEIFDVEIMNGVIINIHINEL